MLGLCETTACRRVRLLRNFGEASAPCGNCDTCLNPPQTWDGTMAVQKALSCVYRTGQRFGAVHLIDVLTGKENDRVRQWRHQRLPVFGIGTDIPDKEWRGVFRQMIALGLLSADHAYGALKLTDASRPVLKGEQRVALRRQSEKGKAQRGAARRSTPNSRPASAHYGSACAPGAAIPRGRTACPRTSSCTTPRCWSWCTNGHNRKTRCAAFLASGCTNWRITAGHCWRCCWRDINTGIRLRITEIHC